MSSPPYAALLCGALVAASVPSADCLAWEPKFGDGTFLEPGQNPSELDAETIYPLPSMNYNGPKEHDDLPSSLYHMKLNTPDEMCSYGGNQTFGEVTSSDPYTQGNRQPWGDRRGAVGGIPAAGPLAGGTLASSIHGSGFTAAGNVLSLEYLTWVRDLDIDNNGVQDVSISRPLDLSGNCVFPPAGGLLGSVFDPIRSGVGFADWDLDGLLDLGEGVPFPRYRDLDGDGTASDYVGVENYAVDANPGNKNDGIETAYPYNRQRLIEDVMEFVDPINNFSGQVNTYANPRIDGITLLPGGMQDTFDLPAGVEAVDGSVFSSPVGGGNMIPILDLMPGGGSVPDPAELFPAQVDVWDMPILLDRGHPDNVERAGEGKYKKAFATHEFGHRAEGWPDLYDTTIAQSIPELAEDPFNGWDIMDNGDAILQFVNTMPLNKQQSEWINPIDLTTVLTPGIEKSIQIVGCEAPNPAQSYYFFPNQFVPPGGIPLADFERFDFWVVSDTRNNTGQEPMIGDQYPWGDVQFDGGVLDGVELPDPIIGDANADDCASGQVPDASNPDSGLLIMKSNIDADALALPPQQIEPSNVTYGLIEADGMGDLSGAHDDGGQAVPNHGDNGDLWPGTCDAKVWDAGTSPSTVWQTDVFGVSGIELHDVEALGVDPTTGFASANVTFFWQPRDTATLTFLNVEGTQSVGNNLPLVVRAYDIFGGTTVHMFVQQGDPADPEPPNGFMGIPISASCGSIGGFASPFLKEVALGAKDKTGVFNVDLDCLEDGTFFFYAFLEPGLGSGGTEKDVSPVRPGQSNVGNGSVSITHVELTPGDPNSARVEAWTLELEDAVNQFWTVTGSESGEQSNPAITDVEYKSTNPPEAVKFKIEAGSVSFAVGDTFTFTTPGWVAYSAAVQVADHSVGPHPLAAFDITPGGPIRPGEVFVFDASSSQNVPGAPGGLTYEWDFGDSLTDTGQIVQHSYDLPDNYVVTLTVTNSLQQFDVASKPVTVMTTPPSVTLNTTPSPAAGGPPPLVVSFMVSANDVDGDDITTFEFDFEYFDNKDVTECQGNVSNFNPDVTSNAPPGNGGQAEVEVDHVYADIYNGLAAVRVSTSIGEATIDCVRIDAGNQAPTASIAVQGAQRNANGVFAAVAPLALHLSAAQSFDPDLGDTLLYEWDFETDGQVDATGVEVDHTFAEIGAFTVTLTVTDSTGASDTDTVDIEVLLPNPNAITASIFAFPRSGPSPLTISFTASATSQNPGPLTYRWELDESGTLKFGQNIVHTFTNQGDSDDEIEVTLIVSDQTGAQAVATVTITVLPAGADQGPIDDPNLEAVLTLVSGSDTGEAPFTVEFSTEGSRALDGTAVTVGVDFGDGTPAMPALAGSIVRHTYEKPGQYDAFSLTIAADGGQQMSAIVTITVTESGQPVASFLADPTKGIAPLKVTFDGTGSSDPEGQPLTYEWDFDDGTPSGFGSVVQHTFNGASRFMVTLTVRDASGATGTTQLEIAVDTPGPNTGGGGLGTGDTGGQTGPGSDGDATGACGLGCGPMGAVQMLAMLLGIVGMKLGRHRRR